MKSMQAPMMTAVTLMTMLIGASSSNVVVEAADASSTTVTSTTSSSSSSSSIRGATDPNVRNLQTTCSAADLVVIDFETAGNGTALTRGDYVGAVEWLDEYGLTITANATDGGFTPGNRVRIFDSSNPGPNQVFGDPDLGSPNRNCPGGGPGEGVGGRPGRPGENCVPLGNILVIQERDKPEPDDNIGGGHMCFAFQTPVDVISVGVIDMSFGGADRVDVEEVGSTMLTRINVNGLGNNAVHDVDINHSNVVRFCVNIIEEGAVTQVTFCQNSDPPTMAPIGGAPPLQNGAGDEEWTYEEPSWWANILAYNGPTNLFRCVKREFPPDIGDACATRTKICYWGDQQCQDVGPFPTTRCTCSGTKNNPGNWVCETEPCPTGSIG